MNTEILKIDGLLPDKVLIDRAAAVVDAGGLVVFPTETVYGIACRVTADALKRLCEAKQRTPEKQYTLHIGNKKDAAKYVPSIGMKARKLVENAWPGPLTIVFEVGPEDLDRQMHTLDEEVFGNLYTNNSIGIRCPAHAVASMLLGRIRHPVVAPSANITNQPPPRNGDDALAQLRGRVDMILDAGVCRYGTSSTVVRVSKGRMDILRKGVYSQLELEEMSTLRFLFVCTGNTCRSPMAEGIFRKYLAEKLGCAIDELERLGYIISSAGANVLPGVPANSAAIAACSAKGIDISAHVSRNLSPGLLKESDLVFVMSQGHRECIALLDADAGQRCMLLGDESGIADPIGGPQEVYNECADLVEGLVKKRISELLI
jgi:protein-tyrosine phosphatase